MGRRNVLNLWVTKREYIEMGRLVSQAHDIALRQSGMFRPEKIQTFLRIVLEEAREAVKEIDAEITKERAMQEGLSTGT